GGLLRALPRQGPGRARRASAPRARAAGEDRDHEAHEERGGVTHMGKMKAYATFDLYLADQPAKNQKIIRALRAFVAKAAPELEEFVKWGNGCWVKGKLPVAYVYSDTDFVQFGFIQGSTLADPKKLLEGNGQYVRHIKVHDVAEIDERAFGA